VRVTQQAPVTPNSHLFLKLSAAKTVKGEKMRRNSVINRVALPFLAIFLLAGHMASQTAAVEGKVIDHGRNRPLVGVHVRLTDRDDSTETYVTATDTNGYFHFASIPHGAYALEVTRVGYKSIGKNVDIERSLVGLGTLAMSEQTIPLHEYIVEGRLPTAVQKGDTTEYNARAFKTNPDATAEDLVTKMPGVVVQNGTVQAQGENVQQVLVDGRPFFGSDPTLALRNMPSEVIDKVQVFDKLSDQAQLTGFDDGQTIKTMNIVTRPERRTGEFGRIYGGYGTDDRYVTSGNVNSFESDRRLSLIGLSNNISQQNFSTQDLLGVMSGGNQRGAGGGGGGMFTRGRRGGSGQNSGTPGGAPNPGSAGPGSAGNFLIGQQSGVFSANSVGLNNADSLARNLFMAGSYFFNETDNQNPQILHRQYVYSPDSSSFYNENSNAEKTNYNHRFNFRFDYMADSSNFLVATPQMYIQKNNSTSSITGINTSSGNVLQSQAQNDNQTNTDGYMMRTHVIYRHKFPTQGRTLSIDVGLGLNRKNSTNTLNSLDQYYTAPTGADTINQQTGIVTDGYTASSNVVYTEPAGTIGLLQINYSPSYSKNISDNRTYNYDALASGYSDLNTKLSNSFNNEYLTNNGGIGYRLRLGSLNGSAGVSYQIASLQGEQSFPNTSSVSKMFYTVLPNAIINYEFSNRRSLRVFYRTLTSSPTITQLQNVVDNSNPLILSIGNPDLKQSYSQTLLTRLSLAETERAQSLLLFFYASSTRNYIGNSTITAVHDTLLPGGVQLTRGTQLVSPVNLDGNWSVRTFCTYGLPIDFLGSNLNLNGGVTYTRSPGLIDNLLNVANVVAVSPGFVLGSNISEKVDFTVSYTANFNNSKNSAQPTLNNNYFSHTAGVKLNLIFWQGIDIKTDLANTLYNGLSSDLNQNYTLWNLSLGKKLFENQQGEILFTVFDLLNQNRSINRTVTETYVQDATTRVLSRYYMVTFSYNLRQFHESRPDI
jgi:hypothetical protein